MAVEAAIYIDTLVPANPPASDVLGEADNHFRLLKAVLQATFPNLTGPVTLTQAQINALVAPSAANTALSALTPAADKGAYFTSPTAAALFDLSAAGRALVDDADATAQRTTLGLGALAVKSTVATADIDADAVTFAKLQNIATAKLLGRTTASSGDVEALSVGTGLVLAAGSLSAEKTKRYYGEYAANTLLTGNIPDDDTPPLSSEGTTIITVASVVVATGQRVRGQFKAFASAATSNGKKIFTAFRGTTFLNGSANQEYGATVPGCDGFDFDEAPSAGTYTYIINAGADTGNMRVNGLPGSRLFGGGAKATLLLEVYYP